MTTKVLKKFMFKKKAYYTDGGMCYDVGSEGDFGYFTCLNFNLYSDPEGKQLIPEEEQPTDDAFYYKAVAASEKLLVQLGEWGYDY